MTRTIKLGRGGEGRGNGGGGPEGVQLSGGMHDRIKEGKPVYDEIFKIGAGRCGLGRGQGGGLTARVHERLWYGTACLVDGHPGFVVVHTGEDQVHSGLPIPVREGGFERVEALQGGHIHVERLQRHVPVDARQGVRRCVRFGHPRLLGAEEQPVHVG